MLPPHCLACPPTAAAAVLCGYPPHRAPQLLNGTVAALHGGSPLAVALKACAVTACRLARLFVRPEFFDPLVAGNDPLAGLHANTYLAQVGTAALENQHCRELKASAAPAPDNLPHTEQHWLHMIAIRDGYGRLQLLSLPA